MPQWTQARSYNWGVENNLNWVLDVVLHNDLIGLRTDNGPANMATGLHATLNLSKP